MKFTTSSIRFRKPFLVLIWLILAMGAVFVVLILVVLIASGVAVPGDGVVDMEHSHSSDGDTIVILTSVLTLMLAVVAGESYIFKT